MTEALAAIAEVNAECLDLWCDEGVLPMRLDEAARKRAAGCPFLFVDLARNAGTSRSVSALASTFHRSARAQAVARDILALAWCVTRYGAEESRMLLGVASTELEDVVACTLVEVTRLAEQGRVEVVPRWWMSHREFWTCLSVRAESRDEAGLQAIRVRGVQLLSAEIWSALRCA